MLKKKEKSKKEKLEGDHPSLANLKKKEIIEIKKEIEETEEPEFEEEASLEEQVLDFDQVDLDNLQDFVSKAPVLDQVAVAPRSFITLERGIDDSPTIPGTEEHDPRKYLSSQKQEEKKYTDMSHIDVSLQRPDFERIGREAIEPDQRAFWKTEAGNTERNFERYDLVKRMDVDKAGKEREEDIKKDRKYDFRLPKS